MAKKIVGLIQPFDMAQQIYVYEDGNKITAQTPSINEINKTIFHLVKEYNVNQVDLIGPKQYIKGLKKKLQDEEFSKYNKNTLIINI